jgi:hypothetical protein
MGERGGRAGGLDPVVVMAAGDVAAQQDAVGVGVDPDAVAVEVTATSLADTTVSWPLTVMPSWPWWVTAFASTRAPLDCGRTTMPAQKPRVSSPRRPSIALRRTTEPEPASSTPAFPAPRIELRVTTAALAVSWFQTATPVRPRSSCIRLARIVVRAPAFSTPANVLSVSVLRVSLVSLLRSPTRMPRS